MTVTTTWADIQRLAADLQRVQLAESSKRLTEANCVEVVSILMSMGLVDLVISTDGKEYITRKHLQTECANECLAASGRIALTDLASQLNVDLDHVNTAVSQLLQQQQKHGNLGGMDEEELVLETFATSEFVVCAGELIHRDFINDICARLDARLQELGHLSMLQLTRQWELPTELLNQHILPELSTQPGARISAIRYEDQLCTIRYINALRRKLRALLISLTKPIPLANIHTHLGIGQSLFFKLWNELADEGKLPGKLLGSKNSLKSLYVPNVHERMAKQYVKQRLIEDHFIENSILKRLSIAADPSAFFRELLPVKDFQDLLFWPSVALSESSLWRECDSLAKNLLQSNHFCLLEDILPSQFTFLNADDHSRVVERLQAHCNGTNLRATEDRTVVYEHPQLIQSWLKAVDVYVRERATKDAPELRKAQLNAALIANKQKPSAQQQQQQKEKEESWEMEKPSGKKVGKGGGGKKGSGGGGGSSGGSGGGRSGKQKGGQQEQKDRDSQSAASQDPLANAQIPIEDLLAELERNEIEIPSSLWDELADDLASETKRIYRNAIAEAWQQQSETGEEQQEMRKAYDQKMAKIVDSYSAICLYEKGTELFEEPICSDLRAYLLRSLCTELASSLLLALADPTSQQSTANISPKHRDQLIGILESVEIQKRVRQLFDSLDTMEKFHEAANQLGTLTGLMLKQPDRKERTTRLAMLGTELKSQLLNCLDSPTSLLLAVLLSFHRFHGQAIHASGKFVSPLIAFLASSPIKSPSQPDQPPVAFPGQLATLLNETQRLVVANIKQKGEPDEQAQNQLAQKITQLKTKLTEEAS